MRTLIRFISWNLGFVAAMALLVAGLYAAGAGEMADLAGMLLPSLLGGWLLFLGTRIARRRTMAIALAMAAGLLFALQGLVLGLLIAFSKGFGGRTHHTDLFEVLLLLVVVSGTLMLWWYARTMRARLQRNEADARR